MPKRSTMRRAVCVLLIVGCTSVGHARQGDVTSVGGWSLVVGATNLVAGAGSDLLGTYQSAGNQTLVTVNNTLNKNDAWRLDVRRNDILWRAGLTLSVKRTAYGSGPGVNPTGGQAYQSIGTNSTTLLSGAGNRSGIALQFQLDGVSIQLPPAIYMTTLTFTLVDI